VRAEIRSLGPVQVTVGGRPAPAELLWRKNLALLVYLARSDHQARARDHLTALLWGDKDQAAGRHSLNEALRVLRRALGPDALLTRGDTVALEPDAVRLDVDAMEAALEGGDTAAAERLAGGEFLEGFGVPDSSDFEDWLAAERLRCRARSLDALVGRAEAVLRAGDTGAARDLAERALALDPASERAARAAMRALAIGGDRAAALQRFAALEAALADGSGALPGADTQALAERIRRERVWKHTPLPSHQSNAARRGPIVGRSAELARMLDAWAECVRRSQPAALVIEGEGGVGKTRMLDELLGHVRLEGAVTSAARAVESDRGVPLGALAALAQGGLVEGRGLAGASPGALAGLAAAAPAWLERFPASVREAPAPLGRALGEVLRCLGDEQPVVLALDDAHQADAESLEAIPALLRDLAGVPVLLALAALPFPRRPELDGLASRVGREVPGAVVRLERLQLPAVAELVAGAFPGWGAEQQDRLARRISADSAGVALLAVELLRAVQAGLDLAGVSEQWPRPFHTLTETTPGDVPDAVVAAVRVSFRKLSPVAQEALAAAAVLDGRASHADIARALGRATDDIAAALDELEWQRWLAAEPRGYTFTARLVRELVARDMVTPGQRRRLRERAGLPA
jgi:DNA-binding SARP family transcriptional activator